MQHVYCHYYKSPILYCKEIHGKIDVIFRNCTSSGRILFTRGFALSLALRTHSVRPYYLHIPYHKSRNKEQKRPTPLRDKALCLKEKSASTYFHRPSPANYLRHE